GDSDRDPAAGHRFQRRPLGVPAGRAIATEAARGNAIAFEGGRSRPIVCTKRSHARERRTAAGAAAACGTPLAPSRNMRRRGSIPQMFRCAWRDWNEDNASRLAASLAYYTALSLAPLGVLGVVSLKYLGCDGRQMIEQQMGMLMGDAGREVARQMIESARSSQGWIAATASTVLLIWGASSIFAALQDAMNTIWEVQLRPE